ncbi:Na/Pi symporter, partial [bacterium]|nr:Na/Pi symporter [bacterium]
MIKNMFKNYLKILLVIVFLYLFLVSIGLMGAAFKGFGKGFAENLLRTTSNPFAGLFIGILATSLVQSSSTTTSILVGMVASGVLTIGGAIPIIMGANIGTTVTNLLVSLGHITRREEFRRAITGASVHDFFNLICVVIMFPLELATGFLQKLATGLAGLFENAGGIKFTSPIKMATKPAVHFIKNLFIDFL